MPPALLNSADIVDYVRQTGMFRPFNFKYLMPASYAIPFLGTWIYWEQDDDDPQTIEIESTADDVYLQPNDIAYMSPNIYFRIPDYMALRFNLQIKHVHRGLLIGTGPLVDPGFEGRLLIPLHNLTANHYLFRGGEGLAWVEFTKLSPNERWESSLSVTPTMEGRYKPFPHHKENIEPLEYLRNAHPYPIRSIIPEVAKEAQTRAKTASDAAEVAKKQATGARSIILRFGWITAIAIAAALAGAIFSVYMLLQNTSGLVEDTRRELRNLETPDRAADLERRVERLEELLNRRGVEIKP